MHNLTAKEKFDSENVNPFTLMTGDVGELSNICVYIIVV